MQGLVVIEARATQDLSRFNLDFAGDSVGRVFVNGRPVRSSWEGEELVITPNRTIRDHRRFRVAVPFTASTTPEDPTTLITPWFATPSGSFTAFQPNYAHTKFPINDHPSDYEGESASTADFIELASRVSHRNLGPFLRDWLYGSTTPPMPRHPDWTVNPPGAEAPAPEARRAPTAAGLERLRKR